MAQSTALFPPINGTWILPATSQTGALPYGPSAWNANWSVGQWNIPTALPAFHDNATSNAYGAVTLGDNDNSFILSQNASALPCTLKYGSGSTMADEYDLLVQPMPVPLLGTLAVQADRVREQVPLNTLKQVMVSGTVKVDNVQEVDRTCKAIQGIVGIAVVLTDVTSHQTMYYQVSLSLYHDPGNGFVSSASPAGWFFQGTNVQNGLTGQFGYGDRAWTSYGLAPLLAGKSETFNFNVLPVLKTLFASQAGNGMDQNLADWAVTGGYFGESAFGHVEVGSNWQHVSITQD